MKCSVDEQEGIEAREAQARIYIGGLGEGITADDLSKILSTVGEVRDVDIIRTKGRSFAYVDFRPSSLNSIPKLFSTYNGCMWKGGRLRLEKAKEHYLDRLKREREEVAHPDHEPENCEEAVVEPPEKKQLRIFFPRLRKAKCVPLSGTGKHRYSFQRVEPYLLPLHICDCQEHSVPSDTAVEKQSDRQEENEVIIDDAEIGIMNSVMYRLFERERIAHDTTINSYGSIQNQVINAGVGNFRSNMLSAAESRSVSSGNNMKKRLLGAQNYREGSIQLASETIDNSVVSKHGKNKKLHADKEDNRKEVESIIPGVSHYDDESKQEPEESETDEDGLILNVLSAANSRIGLASRKKDSASFKQELSQDVHKERPKDILPPKKKLDEERDGSEFTSFLSGKNGDAEIENHAGGPTQSIKDLNVGRYGSQKSSLKALFRDKGNTAFSLSSILPSSDSNTKGQCLPNKMEPVMKAVLKNPSRSCNKKRKSAKDGNDANETMSHRKKGNSQNHSHGIETGVAQHSEAEVITKDSSPIAPKDHNPISDGETIHSNPEPAKSTDSNPEAKSMKHEKPPGEYGRGSSWLHQSSWVQLVSENATFSLSKILPCSSANQEHEKSDDDDVSKSIDDFNSKGMDFGSKRSGDASSADGFSQEPKRLQVIPETDEQTSVDHNVFSTPVLESELGTRKASAGETCLFMRNAASLKEWGKFKAAFRESNKKRSKQEEK